MNVSDFRFELPDELVAQEAAPRGQSRLLIMGRHSGALTHAVTNDLPDILQKGDLLVINNTRVFAARLLGKRVPSGGAVECMLLHRSGPIEPDGAETWVALVHPGQKLKPAARMRFGDATSGVIEGEVLERRFHGRRTLRLRPEGGGTLATIVDAIGHIPLPPYIKRGDTTADRERYQTVYARERGSVAAPTAGLHFSAEMFARLTERGVETAEITLHVGYGTFKPVRTAIVEDHVVDPEPYVVPAAAADAIARAKEEGRRVIAAGTTTTRALEDAALKDDGRVVARADDATVFIYPGFRFQVIDALLTNFHLPQSSLLMLVAAFAGRERVLAAYEEAVKHRYRFYSYGDAMFIQ